MKAAVFDYDRPQDVADAARRLAAAAGSVKVLGGSQSLGPMLNLRLARPTQVLDISALPALRTVEREEGCIRIGAAVTHAEIEDGVYPPLRGTVLQRVAASIAYRAVRNRGTIGGSLAHADPAADWVLTCTALDAELELVSASGPRRVFMRDFMRGVYTTVLEPDELIVAIRVPDLSPRARWGYLKLCRKVGEFAEASCAAVFDPELALARVVVGALDGAPRLLAGLSASIAREGPDAATREAIVAGVMQAAPGHDSIDRKRIAVAVQRCLAQAFGTSTQRIVEQPTA